MLKTRRDAVMVTVNDILTSEEKQIIAEYEESMHKAWTKQGVDKYQQKIMEIIEQAKKRYSSN